MEKLSLLQVTSPYSRTLEVCAETPLLWIARESTHIFSYQIPLVPWNFPGHMAQAVP